MSDKLQNDLGYFESDPYGNYATPGDIQSWGRVHAGFTEAITNLLGMEGAKDWPNAPEAEQWVTTHQKYSDLAHLGSDFGLLPEFGLEAAFPGTLVESTVSSAKEGQRLLGILRRQAGIEGGEDSGHLDQDAPKDQEGAARDFRLFASGAAILAVSYVAYKNWPR